MTNFITRTLSAALLQLFRLPLHSTYSSWSFMDGSRKHLLVQPDKPTVGQVHLIGAGPGDAELITLKAYRLFQLADVVLVDWLVNPELLSMFPASCERVFVGKQCGKHSMSQEQICALLVEYAQSGNTVIRLKGGDPAIFARVAEECDRLTEHQIPFTIVPGITSASGASAYAGIPLTHRDCAQSVRFVTAHLQDPTQQPDWRRLVNSSDENSGETLVFYMGFKRLEMICSNLIAAGMQVTMPIAVIQQATTPEQKVCIGELHDIERKVKSSNLKGPAIIIVGKVVNRRNAVNLNLLSSEYVSSLEST